MNEPKTGIGHLGIFVISDLKPALKAGVALHWQRNTIPSANLLRRVLKQRLRGTPNLMTRRSSPTVHGTASILTKNTIIPAADTAIMRRMPRR